MLSSLNLASRGHTERLTDPTVSTFSGGETIVPQAAIIDRKRRWAGSEHLGQSGNAYLSKCQRH